MTAAAQIRALLLRRGGCSRAARDLHDALLLLPGALETSVVEINTAGVASLYSEHRGSKTSKTWVVKLLDQLEEHRLIRREYAKGESRRWLRRIILTLNPDGSGLDSQPSTITRESGSWNNSTPYRNHETIGDSESWNNFTSPQPSENIGAFSELEQSSPGVGTISRQAEVGENAGGISELEQSGGGVGTILSVPPAPLPPYSPPTPPPSTPQPRSHTYSTSHSTQPNPNVARRCDVFDLSSLVAKAQEAGVSQRTIYRLADEGIEAEVIRRQLEWLPHRDHSWADGGVSAVLVAACRQNLPEPKQLKEEREQHQARQERVEEARRKVSEKLLDQRYDEYLAQHARKAWIEMCDEDREAVKAAAKGMLGMLGGTFSESSKTYQGALRGAVLKAVGYPSREEWCEQQRRVA